VPDGVGIFVGKQIACKLPGHSHRSDLNLIIPIKPNIFAVEKWL